MKIVNGFDLFRHAREKGCILPAFNTTNLEMTYGIVQGLQNAAMPGMVQISTNNLRLSDPDTIVYLMKKALYKKDVPVALHLDHGKSYENACECVDAGFTSIMIDASHLPFEENVTTVRKTVEYCHFYGVPVEAELGCIGGKEDDILNEADAKTDPDMVRDFVARTGCDILAVAVGNVHGLDAVPHIDLPLLEQISKISPVPLVLHGDSGIPFEIIREARRHNLIKINYGADLRRAFVASFGEPYKNLKNATDVISYSLAGIAAVAEKTEFLVKSINE
ncbi:class II aldolase [Selenomonas sp. TAMA-11512]|uniref:class II aldolase n=1 Tax=Selenomonas sp. TAMA-11512 TaxID=3095337 RepID=UPI00308D8CA1|nr:class II aldolase [Selenomonas sp. TAMA-11512]